MSLAGEAILPPSVIKGNIEPLSLTYEVFCKCHGTAGICSHSGISCPIALLVKKMFIPAFVVLV